MEFVTVCLAGARIKERKDVQLLKDAFFQNLFGAGNCSTATAVVVKEKQIISIER